MPVSEDIRGFSELSSKQPEVGDIRSDFVNALGTCLTESLNIQDKHKQKEKTSVMDLSSDSNDGNDKVRYVGLEESTCVKLDIISSGKSLSKSTTFPCPIKEKSLLSPMCDEKLGSENHAVAEEYLSADDHTQSDNNHPYPRSLSLPTPLKLVSAMKGSREKLGAPPKKISVSWGPDVYDPIPTSTSHVPSSSGSQRYRSYNKKKNGKNKQKSSGKSTRGAKGKEKKKPRKYNGYYSSQPFSSWDNSLDMEDDDKVGGFSNGSKGGSSCVDYEVGKSDPYCGHGFMKNSDTRMHFPVAEAT